jgi:hypothetical protein
MAKKTAQFKGLQVNLLHPQGFPQKLPIKFLKWLINYGRFIVIFVEIIVLSAFIYRFKLDSDLADTKDKINTLVPYIQSLSQDEALIKQTQLRLSTIKTSYGKNTVWDQILGKMIEYMPDTTKLNNLAVNLEEPTGVFKIVAQSTSNSDISTFLNNLKNDQLFQNVQLSAIGFDQGTIIFTITGEMK